jgi:hypothetical protein
MIARLAARQPAALAALIRHAGAREAARQRLVDGLGEPAREQVLELLEPVHGRQIVTHVRALRAARARQALPARAERSYTRDLWQLVFASVLAERGSVFNTRSFIRQLLTGMAARHGISYRTLLLDLVAQARPAGFAPGGAPLAGRGRTARHHRLHRARPGRGPAC